MSDARKVGALITGCFHPRSFGGPIKPDYLTDRLGANLDGMLAQYGVPSEEALVLIPGHLSFEGAASLPCAAVTAWIALTGHRRVTAVILFLSRGPVAFLYLRGYAGSLIRANGNARRTLFALISAAGDPLDGRTPQAFSI